MACQPGAREEPRRRPRFTWTPPRPARRAPVPSSKRPAPCARHAPWGPTHDCDWLGHATPTSLPKSAHARGLVHACVHTCQSVFICTQCVCGCECLCGWTCDCVCIQVSVCMYAHVLIRTCVCVHTYAYRCVSVCTYTHVHTQTCAHVGSCTCSHEIMNKGRGARAAPRSPHDGGHPPPQPRPSHPSDQNQRRPGKPSEGRPVPASSFTGHHCARCACPHM